MENWSTMIKFRDEASGLERTEPKVHVRFEDVAVAMKLNQCQNCVSNPCNCRAFKDLNIILKLYFSRLNYF